MKNIRLAKKVIDYEIAGLQAIRDKLGEEFNEAVNLIFKSIGKVVITGIGKSGIIGIKIAASLASTGTMAIFMHAADAMHGDLGMICPDDIVIAISHSGNSNEIVELLPAIKRIGAVVIGMTGKKDSPLAKQSSLMLDIGIPREADPFNLTPTTSALATLAMGDALAITLMRKRNFKMRNYAVYHPGGSIGHRLLNKICDIMDTNPATINQDSTITDVVMEMTEKKQGAVCVMELGNMVGIITEGDLRRAMMQKDIFFSLKACDIMTSSFVYISSDQTAVNALELMEQRPTQISVLPVLDNNRLVGLVRIHDLLKYK